MMSIESIMALADETGERARLEGLEPHEIRGESEIEEMPPFPFPNIGTYSPDGWEEVDRLFVDKGGLGSPEEPALTIDQLKRRLQTGHGYAIVEEGQFQLYLGVFERVKCSRCGGHHSGNATDLGGEPVCRACVKGQNRG